MDVDEVSKTRSTPTRHGLSGKRIALSPSKIGTYFDGVTSDNGKTRLFNMKHKADWHRRKLEAHPKSYTEDSSVQRCAVKNSPNHPQTSSHGLTKALDPSNTFCSSDTRRIYYHNLQPSSTTLYTE
jgi:hypothetical protein